MNSARHGGGPRARGDVRWFGSSRTGGPFQVCVGSFGGASAVHEHTRARARARARPRCTLQHTIPWSCTYTTPAHFCTCTLIEGGMVNLENEISTRSKHRTHSTSATEHRGTLLGMQPHHRADLYMCTCTHTVLQSRILNHTVAMVHTALAMRTADAQAAVQCANMCCPGESEPFGSDRKWLSVGSNAHPHRSPASGLSSGRGRPAVSVT